MNFPTKNTAIHAATATVTRLLLQNASIMATATPATALHMLSVAYKTAGNVIAIRHAYGT